MDAEKGKIYKFSKDNRSVAMPPPQLDIPDVSLSRSSDIDENKERGNWSSGVEFLLSCLSYAVGLGNIWRFPYLCYRNGGGAFLIPYVIMMAFVGLPLFLMELSFGQYASEGPVSIWKISPLFQGLGYAMFLMSSLVGIYYNMILAWALYYLLSSFTSHLPWSSCDNWWNTNACRKFDTRNCSAHNGTVLANGTCIMKGNISDDEWAILSTHNTKMASDEYFHNFVLDLTEGLHDLGGVRWQLALCLLACWAIVFLCLLRGVKSMGKVVYFTALFPYVVLLILLIRGTTLEGSYDGIMFYLTPQWEKLKEAGVWGDAAMQIFFSLSPCWGGLITLASYNRFHNNCFRDALFITFGNSGTSFFAGFVIFSIVGFMAHEMGVPVDKVAAQGSWNVRTLHRDYSLDDFTQEFHHYNLDILSLQETRWTDKGAGLAFVAYPEAVARLPISPLWAFLFFFMLLTLGLGTQFTIIETVVTTIVDTWPERLRRSKPIVLFAICLIMYLLGLIICTKGGMYVLQLMDNYCASFSALFIGLVEVIVIGWIYGAERFLNDIKIMMGHYPFHYQYWRIVWKLVVPLMILFILIFTWVDAKPTKYGDYEYPEWATAVGWCLSLTSVSAIPFVAVLKICRAEGPILQRTLILMKPTDEWGPKLQMHRMETHSPKHTDSQVPLALPNYDPDGYGEQDFSDDLGTKNGNGGDDSSEFEGLRLNIPMFVSETGV